MINAMKIDKYWRSLSSKEKQALADKLNVSKAYLSNVFNGHQKTGAAMAIKIEKKTKGETKKEQFRPDIFR